MEEARFWCVRSSEFSDWFSDSGASGLMHRNSRIAQQHDLARADFAGFTRFDPAVDGHRAVRDHHFCGPATVGEPRYLQKIVQFDVVAGQCEIEVGHGVCALKQRVRIISQKLVLNESPVGLDLALAIASSCYVMLYFCQKMKRSVTLVVHNELHS